MRVASVMTHEIAHQWYGDLGHHGLVGRPVAQRVVRRLHGDADHLRLEAGVPHRPHHAARGARGHADRRAVHGPAHPPRAAPRGRHLRLRLPDRLQQGLVGGRHVRAVPRPGRVPHRAPPVPGQARRRQRDARRPHRRALGPGRRHPRRHAQLRRPAGHPAHPGHAALRGRPAARGAVAVAQPAARVDRLARPVLVGAGLRALGRRQEAGLHAARQGGRGDAAAEQDLPGVDRAQPGRAGLLPLVAAARPAARSAREGLPPPHRRRAPVAGEQPARRACAAARCPPPTCWPRCVRWRATPSRPWRRSRAPCSTACASTSSRSRSARQSRPTCARCTRRPWPGWAGR